MADQDFIYVRERRLPYETFDADNHLYETKDAFTKFLPNDYAMFLPTPSMDICEYYEGSEPVVENVMDMGTERFGFWAWFLAG